VAFQNETYYTIRLSDYWTKAIGLYFFYAIELSEYQIPYWRIQETIGYLIKASIYQTIGYRTQKSISCPPLGKGYITGENLHSYKTFNESGSGLGCALTFTSEAKFEIEAKISFRFEAKKKPDFT
jgi:hypothetical protein